MSFETEAECVGSPYPQLRLISVFLKIAEIYQLCCFDFIYSFRINVQ